MCDVFISYANEDSFVARQLAEHLREAGFDVFWDRKIPIGITWDSYIEGKLRDAKCVVVLWSSHSVSSDWVRAEASEAANRGVLIPATIDTTLPPFRFRTLQTASLVEWRGNRTHEGIAMLTAAVKGFADTAAERWFSPQQFETIQNTEKPIALAEVETGPDRGRVVILGTSMTSVTIGRSRDCDFVLNDFYVSRSHCRIEIQPNTVRKTAEDRYTFTLIDSGSSAGTLLNGKRIDHAASLHNGDYFQIGTARFLFRFLQNELPNQWHSD